MYLTGKVIRDLGAYSSLSALQATKAANVNAGSHAWVGTSSNLIQVISDGVMWRPVYKWDKGVLDAWYAKRASITADLIEKARLRYDVCEWRPGETITAGMCRVPTAYKTGNNSFLIKIHRATTSGVTGVSEPTWATSDTILSPGASSTTTDGSVTWSAYNIYHVDADLGNDTTGDGSQLTPWKTLAKLTIYGTISTCTGMSGRAWALKRGCSNMYTGYPPGSAVDNGILYARDASIETVKVYPERFNILAYGYGQKPKIDPTGKSYMLRFGTSTDSLHHGFVTVADIILPKVTVGVDVPAAAVKGYYTAGSSPSYNSPLHIKLFRLEIQGMDTTVGDSANDFDGVWLNGSGVGLYDCDIYDIYDDGLFVISSNCEIIGNRIWKVATSVTRFPDRERGDVIQLNSSITAGGVDNVTVIGNSLDHTSARSKQTLIINPDADTSFSRGYKVQFNEMRGCNVDNLNHSHHAVYLAGISGVFSENYITVGGYSSTNGGSYFGIYVKNSQLDIVNNVIRLAGRSSTQVGIYHENLLAVPTYLSVKYNTIVGDGSGVEYGIYVASTGSATVACNLVANVNSAIYSGTAGAATIRQNAMINCATGISGAGVDDGSNVTRATIDNPLSMSAWSDISALCDTTYGRVITDFTGASRHHHTTPGAVSVINPDIY